MSLKLTYKLLPAIIGFITLPLVVGCQAPTSDHHARPEMHIPLELKEGMATNPEILPLMPKVLSSYNWQLESVTDKNQQPINTFNNLKKPVSLSFSMDKQSVDKQDAELSIGLYLGCNQMSAPVDLKDFNLTIGSMMTTNMYCADLIEKEQQLTKLVAGTSLLTVYPINYLTELPNNLPEKMQLRQRSADGSVLVWQGTLTDTAKYGKGETVFLEVAPQTVHCSSGINQTCLKVRDVYYNKQSIKLGVGDWRPMKQSIKGYVHNPNTRNVLRVKKYITDPVDVKGKQIVYRLDMVVETEFLNNANSQ